ncbi:alpha/beta fold hydrolase [Aeromicrobium sp. Leaf350]|uniref:alpha/beta fold hydrolase n=1 Tax=Aeromicrobium sp. Leaf350 TaxID=2876565 RepID=UPI001E5F72B6|nr:alpha/beta hydrolase [Aeromicrobium sp. Leaf350]
MNLPEPSTLHGDDLDFAVLSWGRATDPVALLLHGYPDSPHSWTAVAEALVSEGYRVVAPWTRGYAPTDVPPDGSFHIGALAHDALALHGLLGGDERAVLIGHDWGAVAAHAVAGADGQPFRRIVTMAVPPAAAFLARTDGWLPWAGRVARQARLSWYMAFQQVPRLSERSLDRLVPSLWRRWSPGHQAEAELEAAMEAIRPRRTEVLRYYRHAARWWTVPDRYREAQAGLMRRSTVPMLYLHGRDDGCVLHDWSDQTAAVLPEGSQVETVSGAGHFLQVERPDEVARLVLDFIGSPSA